MNEQEKQVVEENMELASKLASKISPQWELIQREEVEAHLWEWLCKNTEYLIKWKNQTMLKNAERLLNDEEPVGDGRPYVSMNREANKYCAEETKRRANRESLNNDNHYSTAIVYRALKDLFTYDFTTHHMQGTDEGKLFNTMFDIMNAFHGLNYKDKDIIEMKYKYNKSMDHMMDELSLSSTAVEKRIERAVNRLYDRLAGEPISWVPGKNVNTSSEWL